MEHIDNTLNQSEEIETDNDQYIVSIENEAELERKGYTLSSIENNLPEKLKPNQEITLKSNPENLKNLNTLSSSKSLQNLDKNSLKIPELDKNQILNNYQTNTHRTSTLSNKSDLNPISLNNPLYSNSEIENLKEKINQKISSLGNFHVFALNNINIIIKFYKGLTDILFKKITTTLEQNKKFLKYFRDIIEAYKKFCIELDKTNTNIRNLNEDNQLLSDNITNLIVSTQDTIKLNFEKFSKTLNDALIANGPFQKINDIIIRFETIKKKISSEIKSIEIKKEKMVKKFNTKSIPIFTNFKKFENKLDISTNNNAELNKIFEENDFFLIEIEINLRINKLYSRINKFMKTYKTSIEDLKKCVIDYVTLMKETVEKFLNENKKIYGGNMDLDFEHMQKFYESITKESFEKSFIVSRILGSDNMINQFNDFFNEYRNDLIKFRIVKNEIISQPEKFNINNFLFIEDLISFMIELIPIESKLNSSLMVDKFELKRDPGVFKSWKNCTVIKTLQNNILVYDEKINKHPVEIFNVKKMKFKSREEKKNPFRFEILEKKKGIIFNSNKLQYFDALNLDSYNNFLGLLNIIY